MCKNIASTPSSNLMSITTHLTADGSTTLYDDELDVHYRSVHGATTEVRHVFIDGSRLLLQPERDLVVLEFGFGGATSFTTLANAILNDLTPHTLHYHSVEKLPVDPEMLAHLSGPAGELARAALVECAQATAPATITLTNGPITLSIYYGEWEDAALPQNLRAHAIFHDPFGPRANPLGWTREVFERERALLHPMGRIATYGAASATRRAMCEAGLSIATLPGPGRKREITIAAHDDSTLLHDERATIIPHTRYLGTP